MQVKQRLGTPTAYADRSYAQPREFLEDMRLIWANCRRFNREMTDVRKFGEGLSDMFEKRWHAAGIEPKWAEEEQRQLVENAVRGVPFLASCVQGVRLVFHLRDSSEELSHRA